MSSSGKEIEDRIADLEVRLMHQEASLDNLTTASIRQERIIKELLAQLKQIKDMFQQLDDPPAAPGDEPPPPHY